MTMEPVAIVTMILLAIGTLTSARHLNNGPFPDARQGKDYYSFTYIHVHVSSDPHLRYITVPLV